MKSERAVGGKRPGSSRPYQSAHVPIKSCCFRGVRQRKFYPDRRTYVVFILNFRFGQCGTVVNAPVDRFQAAVNVALFEEVDERGGDGGFMFWVHIEIGLLPLTQNAQALEIALVRFHVAAGVFAAHAAKLRGADLARLAAKFFL